MAPSRTATKKNPKFKPTLKSQSKSASKVTKRPPSKQVKTKPGAHSNTLSQKSPRSSTSATRKKKTYSDKDLHLPPLNMITPITAKENPTSTLHKKGTGKKKNKIYIDDEAGMRTILAMVTAEKEGQIESKLIRARQLEEVREARRVEMEKRKEGRREELEDVKKGLRKGRRKGEAEKLGGTEVGLEGGKKMDGKSKKRVSFA